MLNCDWSIFWTLQKPKQKHKQKKNNPNMFTTQPITTTSKTQPPAPPHGGDPVGDPVGDVSMVTPHVDPTIQSGSNPPVAVSQKGKRKAAKKKGKKKKKAKKCYESTLSQLFVSDLELISDETLILLVNRSKRALWNKQAWCDVVSCTREEAVAHKCGGWSCRQLGNGYFYLECKSGEFSPEQLEDINDHLCCCFVHGQPCKLALEGDECECMSNQEYGSYYLHLGVDEETFESECSEGLVPAKWIATSEDGHVESLFSVEQLKFSIDIIDLANTGSLEQLMCATQYCLKPEGTFKIRGVTYKSV